MKIKINCIEDKISTDFSSYGLFRVLYSQVITFYYDLYDLE